LRVGNDAFDGEADYEDEQAKKEEEKKQAHEHGSPSRHARWLAARDGDYSDERSKNVDEKAREDQWHQDEGQFDQHHTKGIEPD